MSAVRGNTSHFKRVASIYARVRDTDPEVVEAIIERLPQGKDHLDVADIGCGTGRYSEMVLRHLNGHGRFYCCDYSPAMLAECRRRMEQYADAGQMIFAHCSATSLPLEDGSLDALVTFNAVHHFDLPAFVAEAARILRPGGLLAIYTRTPEQNVRGIWGQHFPDFNEYERRLFARPQLMDAVGRVPSLAIETVKELSFTRSETPDSLLEKARAHHYSTFALYPPDKFTQALSVFEERLRTLVNGNLEIEHQAFNTLLLARRLESARVACDVAP